MYNASAAFHTAVAQGKPQKALLIFNDAVFTNDDINVTNGIQLNDYFSTEDDLAIGQALSNELTFSLFNDDRLLNDYEFGDFLATIGAQTETATYTVDGNVTAVSGSATYVGYSTSPYLKRNGNAVSSQPNFAVKSILVYDGKVYVFGDNKQYAVYKDSNGSNITSTNPVNMFMRDKSKKFWQGMGTFYNPTTRYLQVWKGGTKETYEFVPLGYFTAKRPNVPDVIQIDMHCNDYMTKFDKDMPDSGELGITYPTTVSNLFVKLCEYAEVEYASSSFINSTATISKAPDEFENATMRQVLMWIAELAAANLRFKRDGRMVFDWLRTTTQAFDEGGYADFAPYWYETKQIDKLYNRNTQGDTDITMGTGENAYLIQDNPLLRGVT